MINFIYKTVDSGGDRQRQEGLRFQQVMESMEQIRKNVTPEEIASTLRILSGKKNLEKLS